MLQPNVAYVLFKDINEETMLYDVFMNVVIRPSTIELI